VIAGLKRRRALQNAAPLLLVELERLFWRRVAG
jgi:hypothetical protein